MRFIFALVVLYSSGVMAQSGVDSLLNLIKKETDSSKIAQWYNQSAAIEILTSPKNSFQYAAKAGNYSTKENSKENLATAYLNMGIALRHMGYLVASLDTMYHIIGFINDLEDKKLVASILNEIGIVHYQLGQDSLAMQSYKKSLELREKLKDDEGVAAILNNLGNLYNGMGNYEKAFEYFYKSLKFDEENNNLSGQIADNNNIGLVHYNMRSYGKALEFYLKALTLSTNENNLPKKASVLNNIGVVYLHLTKYDSATWYIEESNKLYQEMGLFQQMWQNYTNLGLIKDKLGKNEEALLFHNKALEIASKQGKAEHIASSRINISRIYLASGKHNKALSELNHANEILVRTSNKVLRSKLILGYANVYHRLKKDDSAYIYLADYYNLKDSIFTLEKEEAIGKIEAQFESEKKAQRIESLEKDSQISQLLLDKERNKKKSLLLTISLIGLLLMITLLSLINRYRMSGRLKKQNYRLNMANEELNQFNQLLAESEEKLIAANNAKNTLLGIISHDLRSPIDRLQQMVYILGLAPGQLSQQQIQEYMNNIGHSMQSVSELLNNLLNWSMTQQEKIEVNYKSINIKPIFDNCFQLFEWYAQSKKVLLIKEYSDVVISTDENMVNFIVRNLLHNAIKFSPEQGHVTVRCSVEASFLKLTVSDEGKGLELNEITAIKNKEKASTRGTNQEKGIGLGLSVCIDFINLLSGKLEIVSSPEKGSLFTVYLPLSTETNS